VRISNYADARDAFRNKDLRQALYDEGHRLMTGVIVNLHGAEHLARRRLENRLFRRDTFAWFEAESIPRIVDEVLAPAVRAGHGDLLALARRTMMLLALEVAGVDRPVGSDAEMDRIYELMDALAKASTVAHATGDKAAIVAAGDDALDAFAREFFTASRTRRADLVAAVARGEMDEAELPRDVLTTLLRNQDRLDLPPETVLREIAYFPWVGSHSTSNELVHAMHHLFLWIADHPDDRAALVADADLRQRFVHESLRMHPASPVALRHALADVDLRSGVRIAAGEEVVIDLVAANRDPAVFGEHADVFDPFRHVPDDVAPWGLSFGHGVHACLGQELAGGLAPLDDLNTRLHGAISVMAGRMLAAGARPDPEHPAYRDAATTRDVFATYPVLFS
jgi:cytochrome P450